MMDARESRKSDRPFHEKKRAGFVQGKSAGRPGLHLRARGTPVEGDEMRGMPRERNANGTVLG